MAEAGMQGVNVWRVWMDAAIVLLFAVIVLIVVAAWYRRARAASSLTRARKRWEREVAERNRRGRAR